MDKLKVSQDLLYEKLLAHDVILSMLAKRMGVSRNIVDASFNHSLNRHGNPLKLSAANVERLNAIMEPLADELEQHLIRYEGTPTFTNNRGTFYPETVGAICQLSAYVKVGPLVNRLFGWSIPKKEQVLNSPKSIIYGRVTADHIMRINADLMDLIHTLRTYEVVAD